jgi:hypothetical protein
MRRFARHICSLVIAAAVLLVSVTCTSAGCLLGNESPNAKPVTVKPACCAHAKTAEQQHHQERSGQENDRCPLCHGPVFVAKVVKNTAVDAHHSFVGPIFSSSSSSPVAPIQSLVCLRVQREGQCAIPPTLLALHCALQV